MKTQNTIVFDFEQIKEIQKNIYPFLMVDRVTNLVPGKEIAGYKNLTGNEWFFDCHWEGNSNMPGMLQLEALLQISSLIILSSDGHASKAMYVVNLKNADFRRKILPGDRLDLNSSLVDFRRGIAKFSAKATVDGVLACAAQFSLVLPELVVGVPSS